jgi:osmotically-inducible protein OsmY
MKISKLKWSSLLSVMASIVVGLTYLTIDARGQQLRTTTQMRNVIARLETNTDRFSRTIDAALDSSRFNNTELEDQVNALVDEMEFATDRLKGRTGDNTANRMDVNEVLRRGMYLDMFMQRNNLSPAAQRDWRLVRNDLDRLAHVYGVTWTWVPNTIRNSALNVSWTMQVIHRLEQTTDQFRSSFDAALDRSRLDGSSYEDFMNNVVAQFERSIDRLKEDADKSKQLNPTDIRLALNNASAIDEFVRRQTLPLRTRRDWARVKANLDDLAFVNQVAWNWTRRSNTPPLRNSVVQAQGERIGLGTMMTNSSINTVAREVRHELLSDLPYYTVFDWIEFEVLPDNSVVLRGEVTAPPDTKMRAESLVENVAGVSRVVNEIRVLPVSPNDERLRRALYNSIYGFNSPLFRYGIGSRQAIHIIVDGGRATLKGIVDTQADKNQAYIRASGVPGVFSVTNDLMVKGESLAR